MPVKQARSTLGISIVAVCALLLAGPSPAFAQNQEPVVGTWNVTGSSPGAPFIAVITFNLGGTTVEYDTAGTNSSASPGESINLGKWTKTANLAYSFKEENYVYDSSGNLFLVDISTVSITLDSTGNTFKGHGVTSFYNCSLSLCPGTLVTSASVQVTGKRF